MGGYIYSAVLEAWKSKRVSVVSKVERGGEDLGAEKAMRCISIGTKARPQNPQPHSSSKY